MVFEKLTSSEVKLKDFIEEGNFGMSELLKAINQLKSEIKILHHAIDQQNKTIERLEDKLDKNQKEIVIGKKMLDLPNKKK